MEQSKKTSFDFYMLPLVLAVAVVPLLTMMTSYSSGIGKYTWASGGSFVDFFLGFKRGALILLGAVIIILFCAAQWMRVQAKAVWTTKNQKIVLILLAVFWGVTAISALLADEKIDALFGGFEQMEGVLVVTAYVALFCLAYFLLSSENKIQVIVHALLIGSLILSIFWQMMSQRHFLPCLCIRCLRSLMELRQVLEKGFLMQHFTILIMLDPMWHLCFRLPFMRRYRMKKTDIKLWRRHPLCASLLC